MHYCFRKIKRRISLLTASFSFLFSKLNKDNQPNAPQPALSPKPTKKASATNMTVACLPQHSCQSPPPISPNTWRPRPPFLLSSLLLQLKSSSHPTKKKQSLFPPPPLSFFYFTITAREEGLFFFFLNPLFFRSLLVLRLEIELEKMDSSQRRKSGINLPASMSESILRLDAISSGSPVRSVTNLPSPLTMSPRTISNLSSPSSKSGSCSDRFIPCRSSSRLHTFGLVEKASPIKEGGNEAYSRLLRSELFGADYGFSSPAGKGSPMSPNKNMLRFKTEHSGPNSPFSPSILGHDTGLAAEVSSTPPKPPRKVPKTPHKVWFSSLPI